MNEREARTENHQPLFLFDVDERVCFHRYQQSKRPEHKERIC
jgi:hypothetical protein